MTPAFDKVNLTKMLLNNDYSFPDDPFEPSSDKPIDNDKLTSYELTTYLLDTYGTGEKLGIYRKAIEKILGASRAQYLIGLNKSEYFKMLAHFAILSKVKRGWFNLLITSPARTSKPSLSDNPLPFTSSKSKKIHDSIIRCFYTRLIEGMAAQERERYLILAPMEDSPTGFDIMLFFLDKTIQDFFSLAHQETEGLNNEKLLPDAGSDEAIKKTRELIFHFFYKNANESYRTDTLRANLIKFSSINRAINDIDANFNIYDKVMDSLPNDIQSLHLIESESEILPAIISTFDQQQSTRKKTALPDDLLDCAKLVCKMYISTSVPPAKTIDTINIFNNMHMLPKHIAVSAARLYQDFLLQNKLSLNIRGETNNYINVYKKVSELANRFTATTILNNEYFSKNMVSGELLKFLTVRHSISVIGLSEFYPSQLGAQAHLKVKKMKFELQKETYERLKEMNVKDAFQCTYKINLDFQSHIASLSHPLD